MDYEQEIPFGAFDSELMHQEINIPEGFEAEIKGNKIILKKTDSKVRKAMIDFFKSEREEGITVLHYGVNIEHMLAWLEKQGDFKPQWLSNFITDYHKSIGSEKVDEINPSEFEIGLRCLLKQFEVLPKEELVDGLSFYLNVVENDGKYVEKQGEQKQVVEILK